MALTYLIAFVPGWAAAELFAVAGLPVLSATLKFLSLVSSLQTAAANPSSVDKHVSGCCVFAY